MSSNLVLASGSPRRQALLSRITPTFQVIPADVPEDLLPGEPPLAYALRLAAEKAAAVAEGAPGAVVIGADTIVVLAGAVLGKPRDAEEAVTFLRRLRGERHTVITAVAVCVSPAVVSGAEHTAVWLRRFTDEALQAYVATGHSMDKAGGYAIQHGDFKPVARISGSETNVVGLPIRLTRGLLRVAFAGAIEGAAPALGARDRSGQAYAD